jgi:hypothetical protein
MRRMAQTGVFCLEGEWEDGLDSRLSVRPLLELIEAMRQSSGSVHRDVATRGELEYYLHRWIEDDSAKYDVAYLAFHGSLGAISLGAEDVTLAEIASIISGGAKGRTIYFGSCGTMDQPAADLKSFCRETGARGVVGYTASVGWSESAAFDLLLLPELLKGPSLKPLVARLASNHPRFVERLGLRIATSTWVLPVHGGDV